jgi:hypothetical protein
VAGVPEFSEGFDLVDHPVLIAFKHRNTPLKKIG